MTLYISLHFESPLEFGEYRHTHLLANLSVWVPPSHLNLYGAFPLLLSLHCLWLGLWYWRFLPIRQPQISEATQLQLCRCITHIQCVLTQSILQKAAFLCLPKLLLITHVDIASVHTHKFALVCIKFALVCIQTPMRLAAVLGLWEAWCSDTRRVASICITDLSPFSKRKTWM